MNERNQVWIKDIKDNINRWIDISCSRVGRIIIVKMTILTNEIYRFIAPPIKSSMAFFFTAVEQKNFLNSYGKSKDPE